MKKIVLNTCLIALSSLTMNAQSIFNVNVASGLKYSPSTISISEGDSIKFMASNFHPLQEVSKTTWDANDNTPLVGGFECVVNCKVKFPKAGEYYYVCFNHAGSSMKGIITVTSPTGLFNESNSNSNNGVKIYPNPAVSDLMIQLEQATQVQNISMVNAQGIEVSNQAINSTISSHTLNVSGFESGLYQVVISTSEKKIYNKVVVR